MLSTEPLPYPEDDLVLSQPLGVSLNLARDHSGLSSQDQPCPTQSIYLSSLYSWWHEFQIHFTDKRMKVWRTTLEPKLKELDRVTALSLLCS